MKHSMYFMMLCIAAGLVAVSCCRCGSKSRSAVSLANTWQLVKLMGQDVEPSGDSFTLTLTEDGKLHGKGSCNRLFGDYESTPDGKISVGQLGSTRMMCPDTERENRFFMVVGDAQAYEIDGDTLMLLWDGEVQAVFTLQAPAEKEE